MKRTMKIIAVIAILSVLAVVFLACVPSNIDAASKKMEKAGYKVSTYSEKNAEGCDGGIVAYDGIVPVLYALHFSSSKEAKSYYNDMIGSDEENKKEAEENNVKQKGKWIYSGTDTAVKAFEK